MLSRVADSLYWMSRYMERAENIARIVDVNLQLMLDFQNLDDGRLEEHWTPIVQSTGDEEQFFELYDHADRETVTDFLTFNLDNTNSILSSVYAARENARMVRDQISIELWEAINRLYLFLQSDEARRVWHTNIPDFYNQIKDSSHLFQGLTDSTMPHSEGWEFIQIGKHIERADMTTRILDVKYHILLPDPRDVGGPVDVLQWSAVLFSCSAYEAFSKTYVSDVTAWKVAEFLILSPDFPRSIKFCLNKVDAALRRISRVEPGNFSNLAEKLSGRLLSDLSFSSIDDIFKIGLHEYLDQLQERFNEMGEAIYKNYIFYPKVEVLAEIQQQQQQ